MKHKALSKKILTELPSNLDFLSASSKKGEYNSSTGLWNVGDINSYETYRLTIKAIYNSNSPATVKSEIHSVNEKDVDSVPNNNNYREDDQTSIVINDYSNNRIKRDISLSLNDLENLDASLTNDEDKQISMNQLTMSQIVEAMNYEPAFSIKSIGLQKDDYHLELQYKF